MRYEVNLTPYRIKSVSNSLDQTIYLVLWMAERSIKAFRVYGHKSYKKLFTLSLIKMVFDVLYSANVLQNIGFGQKIKKKANRERK